MMKETTRVLYWLPTIALALFLVPATHGQEELDQLRLKYEIKQEKIVKPLSDLRADYRIQLEKLEQRFVADGGLKKVLATQAAASAGDPDPKKINEDVPELAELQKIFIKEKSDRVSSAELGLKTLLDAYSTKLKELQSELTKAGKIDEAITVRSEVHKIAGERKNLNRVIELTASRQPAEQRAFEEWLNTVKFRWEEGGYSRYVSGKIMAREKPNGEPQPQFRPKIVEIDSKNRTLKWRVSTNYEEITVATDRKTGTAVVISGDKISTPKTVIVVPRD